MKKRLVVSNFILLFIIISLGNINAINVTGCTTIGSSGYYEVTQNITPSGGEFVFL